MPLGVFDHIYKAAQICIFGKDFQTQVSVLLSLVVNTTHLQSTVGVHHPLDIFALRGLAFIRKHRDCLLPQLHQEKNKSCMASLTNLCCMQCIGHANSKTQMTHPHRQSAKLTS